MTLLLDTNAVSELRKVALGRGNPTVARWAATLDADDLFLSVVVIMELEVGVLRLERRDPDQAAILRSWIDDHLLLEFADRILPVDITVARRAAKLHVPRTRPERDAMIAATALVHGMAVATRNTGDFDGSGVRLIDPWREGEQSKSPI